KGRFAPNPVLSNSNRWIAERIRRAIPAIEPDLMRSVSVGEAHPVVLRQFETTARASMRHDLNTRYAVGIKLVVPSRVERVGPVDPLAVTADLDHLWTAGVGLAAGMGCTAGDAAHVHRARKLGLSRFGDVILTHLSGSPAGDVEELIVH